MAAFAWLAVMALIVVAARNASSEQVSEGRLERALTSRGIVFVVFAVTFLVLWCCWASWNPVPVVHDEMAYVLQAQILARLHWSLPSPPMPMAWQQPHVLTEPRLAAKYYPGHPLVMAVGAALHWVALAPLVAHATSGALLFVLARRLSNGAVALASWVIWLFSPVVLYFGPSYYSEATTTACWLAGWYALLNWRESHSSAWLMLVAFFAGWCAITRPLTGVAYAIPIGIVVLRDVMRERRWRDLAMAFAVGTAVVAIIPLWSARTTGDWRVTPLSLYTRMYMPYDALGFGLDSTPGTHAIAPDLAKLNADYSQLHVTHYPRNLPKILAERAGDLTVSIWRPAVGVLGGVAIVGLFTLNGAAAFALVTGVVLLLAYLLFATPAQWTLYYFESVPAYAFLTASGLAWLASYVGRLRNRPAQDWRSGRWTTAIATASLCLVVSGITSLKTYRSYHMFYRRHLVSFARLLASVPDRHAIMFVRYSDMHDPHVTLVRNTADLSGERVWVVYDRGDVENAKLMALARDRKAYLFDEVHGLTYEYFPSRAR